MFKDDDRGQTKFNACGEGCINKAEIDIPNKDKYCYCLVKQKLVDKLSDTSDCRQYLKGE